MIRTPAIALLAAALLANPRPAQAQFFNPTPLESLNICVPRDIVQPGDADLPMPIAAALAANDARIAIRSCHEFFGSNNHYFARALSRHQNGVCEAKETEIFPGGRDDMVKIATIETSAGDGITLHNLSETPPAAWTALGYKAKSHTVALAAAAKCPAMTDDRYTINTNVPDKALKQIQQFWQQATTSPQAFDQALSNVPFDPENDVLLKRLGREKLLDQFREGAMSGKVLLHDIVCKQGTCRASFESRWIEFAIAPQDTRAVRWGGYTVS